jgi:hypothetical protein
MANHYNSLMICVNLRPSVVLFFSLGSLAASAAEQGEQSETTEECGGRLGDRRNGKRDVVDRCELIQAPVGLKPQKQGLTDVCRGTVIRGEEVEISRQGILGWCYRGGPNHTCGRVEKNTNGISSNVPEFGIAVIKGETKRITKRNRVACVDGGM